MATRRLTTAQALIEFLAAQRVERDGVDRPFFAGCLGIFGHGNGAGIGQALQQHGAVAYSKMRNRLSAWAYRSATSRERPLVSPAEEPRG